MFYDFRFYFAHYNLADADLFVHGNEGGGGRNALLSFFRKYSECFYF